MNNQNNAIEVWGAVADKVLPEHDFKIKRTFFEVLRYIHKMNWQGACHATSAILYVLLREQNYESNLYIGEAGYASMAFDHSWIEIDNKIYDAAVSITLIDDFDLSPVMADIDLSTGQRTRIKYGIHSGYGNDVFAKKIKQIPFGDYMANFPEYPKGLWGLVKEIGNRIGLNISISKIKKEYSNTTWLEKSSGSTPSN